MNPLDSSLTREKNAEISDRLAESITKLEKLRKQAEENLKQVVNEKEANREVEQVSISVREDGIDRFATPTNSPPPSPTPMERSQSEPMDNADINTTEKTVPIEFLQTTDIPRATENVSKNLSIVGEESRPESPGDIAVDKEEYSDTDRKRG